MSMNQVNEVSVPFQVSTDNVSRNIRCNEHIDTIRRKFPLSGDFQEVDFGYVGPVYDRDTGEKLNIVGGWGELNGDIGIVNVVNSTGMEFNTGCYWYVK